MCSSESELLSTGNLALPVPFTSIAVYFETEHLGHDPCKISRISGKAFTYPKAAVVKRVSLGLLKYLCAISPSRCWMLSSVTHQKSSGLSLLLSPSFQKLILYNH